MRCEIDLDDEQLAKLYFLCGYQWFLKLCCHNLRRNFFGPISGAPSKYESFYMPYDK